MTASACCFATHAQWKDAAQTPAISTTSIGVSGSAPALKTLNQNSPRILWIRNDKTGQVITPDAKNFQSGANRDTVAKSVYDNFNHTGGISSLNLNWNYPAAYTDPDFVVPEGGAPLDFGAINISSDVNDTKDTAGNPDPNAQLVGGEKLSILLEPWTATNWPDTDLNTLQPINTYGCVFSSLSEDFEIRLCRIYFFALADVNRPFDTYFNPYYLDLQLSFAFVSFPFEYIASAVAFDLTGFDPALTVKGKGVILTHWLKLAVPPPCPADLNGDTLVDDADFSVFAPQYNILDCADVNMPNFCSADLNGDSVVDDADFSIFIVAYNNLLCPEASVVKKVYAPLSGGRYKWDSPDNTPTSPAPEASRAAPNANIAGVDYTRALGSCDIVPSPFDDRSAWGASLWPFGKVPYQFDASVNGGEILAMQAAMDEIEAVCGIVFVPRTNQDDYIYIQDASVNSSYVGRQGGSQPINIFNWNYKFIMCHELMHAIGLWHEQQRPDRDQYVTVNFANIQPDAQHNYDIIPSAMEYGEYDFESVMHYGACDFSLCCSGCGCPIGCRVMTALPPFVSFQDKMGQLTHLTQGDINGLVSRYGSMNQVPANSLPVAGWPMPNSLLTVPVPNDPDLCEIFGCEPSYNFYLTSHSGLHQIDEAPLDETVLNTDLRAEYERFVNLAFSRPDAIVRKAYPVPSTLGTGNVINSGTQWMPSSTPKLISVDVPVPAAR